VGLSLSDLAAMQDTIDSFAPDTVTLLRTGLQYPVRIDDNGRDLRPFKAHRWFLAREWRLILDEDVPIVIGDQLAANNGLTYLVLSISAMGSYSLATEAYTIVQGTPVIGSTKREPNTLAVGATGGYVTHLASVTYLQFVPSILMPVVPTYMKDTFDVSLQQPAVVYCITPIASEPFPIAANDILVLPSGTYTVYGTEPWVPGYTAIYVEVPIA
jgi:hypothetical protein